MRRQHKYPFQTFLSIAERFRQKANSIYHSIYLLWYLVSNIFKLCHFVCQYVSMVAKEKLGGDRWIKLVNRFVSRPFILLTLIHAIVPMPVVRDREI